MYMRPQDIMMNMNSIDAAHSQDRSSVPQTATVSPRQSRLDGSMQVSSPKDLHMETMPHTSQHNHSMTMQPSPQYQTSNQMFASAYQKSLLPRSKVQPEKKKNQVQNIFAHRRGKSVIGMASNRLPSLDNNNKINTFHQRNSSVKQRLAQQEAGGMQDTLEKAIPTKLRNAD